EVSKAYRRGTIGRADLKEDIVRWLAKLRGKRNPFLRVGADQQARGIGEQFWALKDVSFDVKDGEILGIIGRNGAGKSTLLKILSQITAPTSGEIKIKGRIASLLEIGTGFHPDLTGRENVYLNGTILGMTRSEIRRKFDEIVAFAEIDKFIDTPVKRYSSGMYVRLAFAVAAHVDPDVLIVDEVLAVGDGPFQEKCIGKMGQASRAGRTVLFVSHALAVVANWCDRAILLDGGVKRREGPAAEVVAAYIESVSSSPSEVSWEESNRDVDSGRVRLVATRIICDDRVTADVDIDKATVVQYDFDVLRDGLNVSSSIHLYDKHGTCVLASGTQARLTDRGRYQHSCVLPANFLND